MWFEDYIKRFPDSHKSCQIIKENRKILSQDEERKYISKELTGNSELVMDIRDYYIINHIEAVSMDDKIVPLKKLKLSIMGIEVKNYSDVVIFHQLFREIVISARTDYNRKYKLHVYYTKISNERLVEYLSDNNLLMEILNSETHYGFRALLKIISKHLYLLPEDTRLYIQELLDKN